MGRQRNQRGKVRESLSPKEEAKVGRVMKNCSVDRGDALQMLRASFWDEQVTLRRYSVHSRPSRWCTVLSAKKTLKAFSEPNRNSCDRNGSSEKPAEGAIDTRIRLPVSTMEAPMRSGGKGLNTELVCQERKEIREEEVIVSITDARSEKPTSLQDTDTNTMDKGDDSVSNGSSKNLYSGRKITEAIDACNQKGKIDCTDRRYVQVGGTIDRPIKVRRRLYERLALLLDKSTARNHVIETNHRQSDDTIGKADMSVAIEKSNNGNSGKQPVELAKKKPVLTSEVIDAMSPISVDMNSSDQPDAAQSRSFQHINQPKATMSKSPSIHCPDESHTRPVLSDDSNIPPGRSQKMLMSGDMYPIFQETAGLAAKIWEGEITNQTTSHSKHGSIKTLYSAPTKENTNFLKGSVFCIRGASSAVQQEETSASGRGEAMQHVFGDKQKTSPTMQLSKQISARKERGKRAVRNTGSNNESGTQQSFAQNSRKSEGGHLGQNNTSRGDPSAMQLPSNSSSPEGSACANLDTRSISNTGSRSSTNFRTSIHQTQHDQEILTAWHGHEIYIADQFATSYNPYESYYVYYDIPYSENLCPSEIEPVPTGYDTMSYVANGTTFYIPISSEPEITSLGASNMKDELPVDVADPKTEDVWKNDSSRAQRRAIRCAQWRKKNAEKNSAKNGGWNKERKGKEETRKCFVPSSDRRCMPNATSEPN